MSRYPVDESAEFELALDREDRGCPKCGGRMHVRTRRSRSILTLEGPLRLSVGLVQCCDERCEDMTLYNPEQESGYAMLRWGIGWDVFCWIGQRRFSRHWSVPQIRNELRDTFDLRLSDDAIEDHIASYQNMVAARHQDPQELATLYVVREVTQSRVWFAEPLLTGATDEIRRLFVRAHEIADGLGLKVVLWISDKQDAFVKCVAEMFPDVPHRFCANHFFRNLAKPVLALDSTAKKKMRAKIRGLRALEREVLEAQQTDKTESCDAADVVNEAPDISSLAGEGGSAAIRSKQKPRTISFTSTCQFVLSGWAVHASGQMSQEALRKECDELLKRIAECRVGDRPGRLEPRVIKRHRHGYPLMQRPRDVLRAELRKHCT